MAIRDSGAMATTAESTASNSAGAPSPSADHAPGHALSSLLATVADELRARRAARTARLQLIRELSTYTQPGDLDDLYATLDRYDDADADEIRSIISRVRAA